MTKTRDTSIRLRWDDTTDPGSPGWLVLCRIDGRWEWMAPAPGTDEDRDADKDALISMAVATRTYHDGRTYDGTMVIEEED